MAVGFRPLLFILLAVRFSTCTSPHVLTKEFSYDIPKSQVLSSCKTILNDLGYEIDIFAPESGLIVTKKKKLSHSFRRYDYAVVVIVSDKIRVFLSVKKWIFVRGSEVATGGGDLYQTQTEDALPEILQNRIFEPIIEAFNQYGFRLVSS